MKKNNNFIKGAFILTFAGIVVKILGAIYRIPIGNIIKSEGMGYYSTAYPFYVLLLTISTSGFPVAIAKLVSEKRAIGDYRSAFRIFKIALTVLVFGGVFSSMFLALKASDIVTSIGNENAYYALVALAPALLFVPIMAAFRGFFQGCSNMIPTAISQIGEQLFRVLSGFLMTIYFIDKGLPMAAGAASFGGSIGAFVGTIIIIIIYITSRKSINKEIKSSLVKNTYSMGDILYDLLIIAIPITIGAAIIPIIDTIDAGIVLKRLQGIGYSDMKANSLYGQLKGYAQTLVNLPQVFSMSVAMSLVPAIASSYAKKDKKAVADTISSGIRITLLIGLPSALGLFVLAKPIISLLFFNNTLEVITNTSEILRILSFGVIFLTLTQTSTSILQGLGKPLIPVINLCIGAIIKIGLTFVLTSIESINIKGAAISTVVTFFIAAILNISMITRKFKVELNYRDIFIKPILCSSIMAIITKLSFDFISKYLFANITTIISIAIGGLTYIILLIITKTITKEELESISKNKKLPKRAKVYR